MFKVKNIRAKGELNWPELDITLDKVNEFLNPINFNVIYSDEYSY